MVFTRDQKSKNPDNLRVVWRHEEDYRGPLKLYSHQSGYTGSIVLCRENFKIFLACSFRAL
ncbi:protein CopA/IncA [Salmonella enterica subsp. enterica serovar Newport]|nr:protein CopA/IncA [Salmonella enterica]EDH6467204.1 protein CopA/IncA [Salmonella enterica subsp. enterica serovar Newport]EDH6535287.1 protein CopA/IncA [Salmonella enterica subsp. enterica serovar Richmond]EDH7685214.1 protein CopA/IncA [Salmonella enterica subsp. enterica serovar Typhimurium]EDK1344509.1 protein CopA/IncA [Salmonella enterica subsp. enterica serovar Poona]EDN3813627.1 protein CopA/IncA [Salmonella enterica subsp. enterica serovar Chester]